LMTAPGARRGKAALSITCKLSRGTQPY
jgi:hypothetical protein